jgi:acyl carrier protein
MFERHLPRCTFRSQATACGGEERTDDPMSQERLRAVFARMLALSPEQVTDALAYRSVLQWDSVSHMALVAALEDEFDVMLETEEVIDLSTVAKAREILARHGVAF